MRPTMGGLEERVWSAHCNTDCQNRQCDTPSQCVQAMVEKVASTLTCYHSLSATTFVSNIQLVWAFPADYLP